MTLQAQSLNERCAAIEFTAPRALVCGEVVELPDGRAGVVAGLAGFAEGDLAAAYVENHYLFAKVADIVLLAGQEVWFVPASNAASYWQSGAIRVGVCIKDAAASDTTVAVDLNAVKTYAIDTSRGQWTTTAVNQSADFTALAGGTLKFAIDNGNEAGKVVLISDETIDVDDKIIMEGRLAIFDASDNTVDINVGLASADHATDFEAIATFAAIHVDGGSTNILVHSDDGTTDVAPVDSTLDYTDDAYLHLLVDARDKEDVKIYVNGVLAVPDGTTLAMTAYTSTLHVIAHAEKTTGTATAEVRVEKLRAWAQRA